MILLFLLLIVLLLFIYTKRDKIYYVLLFILSTFSFVLIKINPDINQKYNLRQILYLIDRFNFLIFIILSILIITLLILIIFDRTNKKRFRIILSLISILATFFVFLILLAINIFLIKEPLKNHFEGYVYDQMKNPLIGVKVANNQSDNKYVLTGKNGFFRLERKKEIDNNSNLIFIKKGYKDSLILIKVNNYHPPGSYFLFLRDESDTLIIKSFLK
ncbi:hypothetical protein AR687_17255 [Flavobacteriaceae bacterium CRH]|nr:hypothetical protein AR687_17255 [Flavobacteriaceae bacterium CRH]